ncbi:hypothetical protein Moror_1294 [Moniliophthora roreri MCA 2997]|nr:hypothetical protein Moror_1294 [Moniliophthora roreri MCA 2997]KAI3601313.1 hypothetical protein WG66_013253 [Moniliophthora roreri]
MSDLNKKENTLDKVYSRAPKVEELPSCRSMLGDVLLRRIELKNRASKIRTRSLDLDAISRPIWKVYLDFHPTLVSDILAWNADVEILIRNILVIVESVLQDGFETQLTRSAQAGVGLPSVSFCSSVPDVNATIHDYDIENFNFWESSFMGRH